MIRLWILAAAISLLSAPASASTVTVEGVDPLRGGNLWLRIDNVDKQAYAGIILIDADDGMTPMARSVVCADLFVNISINDVIPVNETAPSTSQLQRAAWLFLNRFPEVASVTLGQALQIAIWDVIHDNGNGLSAGRVRADTSGSNQTPTAVRNAVAAMLSASVGRSASNAIVYTHVNGPTVKQTLLGAEVPEPGTLALFGAGLVAIGLRKRRKKS